MNNNWHQVKEIFSDALRQKAGDRSSLIDERCSGDMGLQVEIESLLSSYDSSESFLETNAVEEVAEALAADSHYLKDGDFLNHYRIVKKIGAGGMGEVYLASDTKLGRQVAIKVLSDSFETGQSNLKRFFLEAKAASGLNHPNIMVVHEIGELDGTHYIACEYIGGETLSDVTRERNLSLIEIADISTQIVSALAAAHEVGIIHRDIKTDNLMLRADGIVKVLDFGLVKMAETKATDIDFDADTQQLMNTGVGMILGTAAYMSPEQARGRPVDLRTDIWSFGVVLYHLVTRSMPFPGETPSDIIAAILKSEPLRITDFVSDIPDELEAIIKQTLQKDPALRYSSAKVLLEDLKRFRHNLEYGTETEPLNYKISEERKDDLATDGTLTAVTAAPTAAESARSNSFVSEIFTGAKTRPGLLALILASVAFLITGGYFAFTQLNRSATPSNSFLTMEIEKLTFEGNAGNWAAVSPDGKYVVYVVNDETKQGLVVRQVESAGIAEIIPPSEAEYFALAFAPDGNNIYYGRKEKTGNTSLSEIPVLGGNSRKLVDNIEESIALSPNGSRIAFVREKTSIVTVDSKGNEEKIFAKAKTGEAFTFLSWSADGNSIFSGGYSKTDPNYHLVEIDAKDGREKWRSNDAWRSILGVSSLSDGSGIIISGRDLKSTRLQLWFIPYPTGEPTRITNDLINYYGASLTNDGKSLVAIKNERIANLWKLEDSADARPKQVTFDEGLDEGLSGIARASGESIIYTARATGDFDIWSVNEDGSGKRQLTAEQGSNGVPVVSPDGKTIVFVSNRAGKADLWRMNIDGSNQVALTKTPEQEGYPSLTPDGKWVIYHVVDSEHKGTIWKMSINGGTPIRLTELDTGRPTVTPDGKLFACDYGSDENAKIAIFPIDGGRPIKILDSSQAIYKADTYRWSSDGKALIYYENRDRTDNLWSQPIDGGEPKQLTFFDSGTIYRFEVTYDRRGYVISRGKTGSDVVLISNFR